MADENPYYGGNQPAPQKSSSVWTWVLGIGAVVLVVCCGGGGVAVWQFTQFVKNAATEDPVKIRAQTAEMVDMEIPDKYEPKGHEHGNHAHDRLSDGSRPAAR